MSSTATSPCTSPHVADLPDQLSITFDRNELVVAVHWCERFAPAGVGEYVSILGLYAQSRTWMFTEANAMGYYVTVEPSPCEGFVPITRDVLSLITDLTTEDDEDVTICFNILKGVFEVQIGGTVVEVEMPRYWEVDHRFNLQNPTTVTARTADVVAMGRALLTVPVDIANPPEPIVTPFITAQAHGGVLTASRNWRRLDGPKISASLPFEGEFNGEFSCFAVAVAREMFHVDTYCGDSVSFEFSNEGNPLMRMSGERCGVLAILCEEQVHEYRQSVLNQLTDAACDLEVLDGNEWDPFIHVKCQSQDVEVAIMSNDNKVTEYVRVSTVITDNTPWNIELAEEINSWNGAWVNSKIVRADTQLTVIADVLIENLSTLEEVVDDLVNKSRRVKDFIAIFQ